MARKLAKKLGFIHLNSGGLYRAVGLRAREQAVSLDDENAVREIAAGMKFSFQLVGNGTTELFVDGENVEDSLSSQDVGELASRVAVHPQVRNVLTEVQRAASRSASVVLEGRDAGTVVFPESRYKFFLDATLDVRARRRLAQLSPDRVSDEQHLKRCAREIAERDTRDSTRAVAPQVAAGDAHVIDTSYLTVDQVVDKICSLVQQSKNSDAGNEN